MFARSLQCIPEQSAAAIGWEPSPFQYEVGVANLWIGLASLYAAFNGFGARTVVAVMAMCFLGGAGLGHIKGIASSHNLAPGNAGPILYTDFLTPIAILILLFITARSKPTAELSAEVSLVDHIEEAVEASPTPRIEDELEKARQVMRDSLMAGPTPELLPPLDRVSSVRSGKSPRREDAADISDV